MSFGISTVLPVFFRELSDRSIAYLTRALDSVLDQDYPGDFEIIVVDDGSAIPIADLFDGTAYRSNSRIRWMRLPRNSGLANALNFGLRVSNYDFIARIDADDSWRPQKIKKQMQLFMFDSDLSIVGTGMALVHEDGDPPENLVRPGNWPGILKFFAEVGCPFPHGSIVARRPIFTLLGGYPQDARFSHCEDFALWGLWLRFFKPAMVEEVLLDYTVSMKSVSSVYSEQQRGASRVVHQRFLNLETTMAIPSALQSLAETLGFSIFEVGKLCFLIWKYMPTIAIPKEAVRYMRMLMPDRQLFLRRPPSNQAARSFADLLTGVVVGQTVLSELVEVEILC